MWLASYLDQMLNLVLFSFLLCALVMYNSFLACSLYCDV